ncbi:hypothetical protein [Streptomyces specialis]|uniref:hypothetical protein n=1 Tax=Streptomyces specialis TaxID=498367 RepID=UPI000A91DD17|nr:hypothetical protein [Streptomyces specialis]
MSQPWQPQPPPPGPGHYGYPAPGGWAGMPMPMPPPARRSQPGAAIALTAAVAVAVLLLYGFLTGLVVDFESLAEDAIESGDPELDIPQLTWLAAAMGALIGLPAARLAPGQAGTYWFAGAMALVAMLLGETFATAVLGSEATDGAKGAFELFFDNFSDCWEGWTEDAHGVTWALVPLAPAAAILTGYLLGRTRPTTP